MNELHLRLFISVIHIGTGDQALYRLSCSASRFCTAQSRAR